jgi:hypothetical protein
MYIHLKMVVTSLQTFRNNKLPSCSGLKTGMQTGKQDKATGSADVLRVFENRVLKRIFGPRGDEVTGGWRKLHNEELRELYYSPSIIRIMKSRRLRWARHVARIGEKRNVYKLLVGKLEGKRPLGRPRLTWLDNIRMDLVEVGWGDVDWIGLAQDRDRWRALVNSVLNLRIP